MLITSLTPKVKPRQVLLWTVGALLSLHILLVLTTWQCPDVSTDSSSASTTQSFRQTWLFGHSICQHSRTEERQTKHLVHDSFLSWNEDKQPRPYAYVFCITSLHNLCTALLNVIRLRKLQTSEEADIVAMVPQAWAAEAEAAVAVGSMHGMRQWAVDTVRTKLKPFPVDSAAGKQPVPIHLFQGVEAVDYDTAGMLAKLIALGVTLRPSDIFERGQQEYNKTLYRRESQSKLLMFDMTKYEKVLYLDADGLVMRNMDAVFEMDLDPIALLSSSSCLTSALRTNTRVLLLRPAKKLHAMLQFVLEKDPKYDDIQLLTEFFDAEELHRLPASFAVQSCDFRKEGSQGKTQIGLEQLQHAHYIHFADSPDFPKHWEWEDMSRIVGHVPKCPGRCVERAAWLYLYSVLTADRESHCLY